MPEPILMLATANKKKVVEMQQILAPYAHIRVVSAADFTVPEPEETGDTFAANAELKAMHYANATGLLSLADDSGLVVDALGGRPGVYSSRYAPTDPERITRLLTELENVPMEQRSARFECAMCLARPAGVIATSRGALEGRIASEPRGANGFGYDPIFYVPQLDCHLAEASAEQKNQISHRGIALQAIMGPIVEALG